MSAHISTGLKRGLEALAALSLVLMMVITFIDVFGRYFFNTPITGATELIEILLALMVFMAFPLVSWDEEHISVDLFDNYFPKSCINIRQAVINLVCSVALILVAMTNWKLAGRSLEYEEVSEVLEIPTAYITYLIAVTGFLGGLFTLANTAMYTKKMLSGQSASNGLVANREILEGDKG